MSAGIFNKKSGHGLAVCVCVCVQALYEKTIHRAKDKPASETKHTHPRGRHAKLFRLHKEGRGVKV